MKKISIILICVCSFLTILLFQNCQKFEVTQQGSETGEFNSPSLSNGFLFENIEIESSFESDSHNAAALQSFETSARLLPRSPEPLQGRADSLEALGRAEEAKQARAQAQRLAGGN